jgi:hypothetical protein
MKVINHNSILAPEEVHKHFVLEGSRLYRKLASGAAVPIRSMDGNYAVTLFNNQRLRGVDIAWCLIHGNWPEFPIVQIGQDPLDFSVRNLFAARLRRYRYAEKQRGALFYHPLSKIGHATSKACRAHWEMLVVEYYSKDSPYVAKVEAYNREMREKYLRETAPLRQPDLRPEVKPSRPPAKPGREWHWYKNEWIDIPVAIHVADDHRLRIEATLAGCTEFRFDPDRQQVFAYRADGSRWTPAMQ